MAIGKSGWLITFATVGVLLSGVWALGVEKEPLPSYEISQAVVATGVVEPFGEERNVSAETSGVLQEVPVKENDEVAAGQVIATIANEEQQARLQAAKAELEIRKASLDRALAGARPEERREIRAILSETEAAADLAARDYERRKTLMQKGVTTQAALEAAKANKETTSARRAAALQKFSLLEAGSRPEDIAAARAQVDLAQANVAVANAQLNKTVVRSPIAGTVLRINRRVGESVGLQQTTPLVVIGDLHKITFRAQVDEKDIGRIKIGDRVEIKAEAYPNRMFLGTTSFIAPRLGAKTIVTDRPTERIDTKVLEVIVDLDGQEKLPIGLRVDVYFKKGAS